MLVWAWVIIVYIAAGTIYANKERRYLWHRFGDLDGSDWFQVALVGIIWPFVLLDDRAKQRKK